jgi:prophage regulatory protein
MLSSLRSGQAAAPKSRRFVRFPELNNRFGLTWCRMHVDREEKAGRFPKRVQLGPNSVAWLEDEIIAWQAERIAARDRPPEPEPSRAA